MSSYCPTCGAALERMPVKDIYAYAFSCANDHRFLRYKKDVLAVDSARAGQLDTLVDTSVNDLGLIEYWLTDEIARSHLNGQLAEILQNIYWSYESDHRPRPKGNSFVCCPICSGALENFEQDDAYHQGKKCINGHEFYERGGRLNYTVNGERAHLVCEKTDDVLASLLDGWLSNNPLFESQLHPQVRAVMERYRR